MIYELCHRPKNIEIALLDKAISFACDYLDLDLDFILEFKPLKQYQFGFCDYDEEEIILTISKSLSKEDTIRTIFHEMVHIKQYADGRLINGSPQRWLGKIHNEEYKNLPWELESFDVEQKMINAFLL